MPSQSYYYMYQTNPNLLILYSVSDLAYWAKSKKGLKQCWLNNINTNNMQGFNKVK